MPQDHKPQQSSVRPWTKYEDDPNLQAQFGILSKLDGTWVNWKDGPTGMHTTCMPSPGTSSETIFGVFHFKSQLYTEQLKFTAVDAPVRNRGGSNEQFNGAVKYETAIIDLDKNVQHFEDGMYLWLGDNHMPWKDKSPTQNPPTFFSHASDPESVKEDGAEPVIGPGVLGPQFVPPHTISRSGVIPHGTTIHLTGDVTDSQEGAAPEIAELWEQQYLAVSPTMGINVAKDLPDTADPADKPDWTKLPREDQNPNAKDPANRGVNSGRAYFEKIFNYDQFGAAYPYTVQPNLKLTDANEGLTFRRYDLIELDSQHNTGYQGATVNNAMVERYCRVVRMRFRMWLEEIEVDGRVIEQLQYEQIVDFEFMFGSNGGTTQWPHIQVNTLRRLRDIPEDKRLPLIKLPTASKTEPDVSLTVDTKDSDDKPEAKVRQMGHHVG